MAYFVFLSLSIGLEKKMVHPLPEPERAVYPIL